MVVKRKGIPGARIRLAPEQRRKQLLDVAYGILDELGPQGIQISEVAIRAGVSRPLVYRFFSNSVELLNAVIEDFTNVLAERFSALTTQYDFSSDPHTIAAMFVHTCCDLIEERGGGIWDLLMSRSADREVVQFAETRINELMLPWYEPLEAFCGSSPTPAPVIADMLVRVGDVALNNWVTGRISRDTAVTTCVTSIAGMLIAFSTQQSSRVATETLPQ